MGSTWNEIRSGLGGAAKKINEKADRLSTVAAIRIKIAATRADIEAEYTELGHLVYMQSCAAEAQTEGNENVVEQERINACICRISALAEIVSTLTKKLESLS